jgi:hypothetical protein
MSSPSAYAVSLGGFAKIDEVLEFMRSQL